MTIKRIQSGRRMSQVVTHGGIAYLAGQVVPVGATERTVGEQTRFVLEQIDRLLAEAGTNKEHLLSASIWLADIEAFAEMNEMWDAWVASGCAPARATVEARLARPECLVEIAVIAAIP
ncbi:RidA family protein [Steroidobacter cummioxidans]|uniref:RidA family protein n=1 Tax=Steroidobacter cummioxidans TaxID=1803913 RepID=UPI000E318D79|nr:RidA family protein [Steroidobacter cummioxidans]